MVVNNPLEIGSNIGEFIIARNNDKDDTNPQSGDIRLIIVENGRNELVVRRYGGPDLGWLDKSLTSEALRIIALELQGTSSVIRSRYEPSPGVIRGLQLIGQGTKNFDTVIGNAPGDLIVSLGYGFGFTGDIFVHREDLTTGPLTYDFSAIGTPESRVISSDTTFTFTLPINMVPQNWTINVGGSVGIDNFRFTVKSLENNNITAQSCTEEEFKNDNCNPLVVGDNRFTNAFNSSLLGFEDGIQIEIKIEVDDSVTINGYAYTDEFGDPQWSFLKEFDYFGFTKQRVEQVEYSNSIFLDDTDDGYQIERRNEFAIDTTNDVMTINATLSPDIGEYFTIWDYTGSFNTNNVTVDFGDEKFEGASSTDFVCDKKNRLYKFVYQGETNGWYQYNIKKGNETEGFLGELKSVNISYSGATTLNEMRSQGWAVADGTTPVSQGITNPDITTTPDMRHRFIRSSNDNTSGTTGGEDTHVLTISEMPSHTHEADCSISAGTNADARCGKENGNTFSTNSTGGDEAHENRPEFYESVLFMKVKKFI
jgi:hypothetical protein